MGTSINFLIDSSQPIREFLNTKEANKILLSKKNLVNLLCTGCAENSDLSGDRKPEVLEKGIALLKHVQNQYGVEIEEELIARYQYALDIQKEFYNAQSATDPYLSIRTIASKIADKVTNLKPEETAFIPIGYDTHTSGHFMMLDISNRGNGSYDVAIYTTGAGIKYHESIVDPEI